MSRKRRDDTLTIAMKEFEVLHSQILERSRIQQQIFLAGVSLGVGVLSALSVFVATRVLSSNDILLLSYFLLFISIPFVFLVQAYAYADFMIAATASYLHKDLRRVLVDLVGSEDFLRNELWFAEARRRKARFWSNWGSFHQVLLFFPFLFISIYFAIAIGGNGETAALHLTLQAMIAVFDICLMGYAVVESHKSEKVIQEISS